MVSLRQAHRKLIDLILLECGQSTLQALVTYALDRVFLSTPRLHVVTFVTFVVVEIAISLAKSPKSECLLSWHPWSPFPDDGHLLLYKKQKRMKSLKAIALDRDVHLALWAFASYYANNYLLSTRLYLTLQLDRYILAAVCSSTARMYFLLDGPAEDLSVEWMVDSLRAIAHFLMIGIFLARHHLIRIVPEVMRKVLALSREYYIPALTVFVTIASIFLSWCFFYSMHPKMGFIRLYYLLALMESSWFERRTKAVHYMKQYTRDHFETCHHNRLIKEGFPPKLNHNDTPLKPGHIRLLKLKRRFIFSGLIDAELVSCSLQDAESTYEALSYRWDPPDAEKKLILVNGSSFNVQPNLHALLHSRSMFFADRWVWTDAICIDQDAPPGNKEKEEQIRLMGDIYKKSKRTIGWLGEFPEAALAVRMIRSISRSANMYERSQDEIFTAYLWKNQHPEWLAFSRLIRDSYFFRVWVFQEISLGREFQFNIAGQYISFGYLNQALYELRKGSNNIYALLQNSFIFEPGLGYQPLRDDDQVQTQQSQTTTTTPGDGIGLWQNDDLISLRRHYGEDYELPLGHLLSKSASVLQASMPHDKVYGLLGVAGGVAAKKVVIDYNKTPEDVFKDVAIALLQPEDMPGHAAAEDACLLFSYAGIGFTDRSMCLPSWVPDWEKTSRKRQILNKFEPSREKIDKRQMETRQRLNLKNIDLKFDNYATGGTKTALFAAINDTRRTLTLKAVLIEKLHKTGDDYYFTGYQDSLVDWFRRIEATYNATEIQLPSGQDKREAFWRTLIADHAECKHPAPTAYSVWFQLWKALRVNGIEMSKLASVLGPDRLRLLGVTAPVDFKGDGRSEQSPNFSLSAALQVQQAANSFAVRLGSACADRQFCITSGGRPGLVPPGSCAGDVVCVVPGLQVPLVVRLQDWVVETEEKETGESGQRLVQVEGKLVGECYVHGIMDGEAADMETQTVVLT